MVDRSKLCVFLQEMHPDKKICKKLKVWPVFTKLFTFVERNGKPKYKVPSLVFLLSLNKRLVSFIRLVLNG